MKISSSFYIRSWLKNSLMAIGTGFVMGYFSLIIIPLSNSNLIGAILAFIIYQYVSFDRFFGARRGEFEYEYRNDLSVTFLRFLCFMLPFSRSSRQHNPLLSICYRIRSFSPYVCVLSSNHSSRYSCI